MPGGVGAALCGLALCAALVAMADRRDGAMLAALGVAIGLGPGGLLLIPLMGGVTIRRRAWRAVPFGAIAGGATWLAIGPWSTGATLPSLWVVAATWPSLFALIVASGVAFAAWTAANASARGDASDAAHDRLALLALVGGALFVPTPAGAVLLPLMIVLASKSPHWQRQRPANDNHPVRRSVRLAA
ncbi:hypothetical protein EAH84_11480 [Sphingomonas oligophenolica]|uniref:Uncharacterized protein n=2 Tax=Sphingomonas oligophenolica TaxID=301154 RepID=A0A502CDZ3_9SPHN|nr:hypothetical protein EAH84_11480 [Sphingomonas oligophenolica]